MYFRVLFGSEYSVYDIALKLSTSTGSLKVSDSTSVVKLRPNDTSSGPVISGYTSSADNASPSMISSIGWLLVSVTKSDVNVMYVSSMSVAIDRSFFKAFKSGVSIVMFTWVKFLSVLLPPFNL